MSVVGFDLSTDTCCVAIIPNDNITYRDVKNRENDKETPIAICFDGKKRIIGKLATGQKNCFSQVMKIIGKTKSDLKSEPELSCLLEKGPNDLLLVRLSDLKNFSATHLLGMILSDLKATAERVLKVDIGECCIGIPGFFSESQRTAVRQAAEVAGLKEVSLLEATTAISLGNGVIRRKVHQQDNQYNIVVVDIGSTTIQVSIMSLKRERLDVLSFAYDPCTGEQSFVDVLVKYFKKMSVGYDDVSLREVYGKLKEQSKKKGRKVELMYGGKQITRSMFEVICEPIWNRLKALLEKAVTQAAIGKEKIDGILVSGSGSEICGIKEFLEGFFPRKKEAAEKHVILAVDSVAKGCTIQCAITSEAFKLRKDHERHTNMKECLLNFKVSDNWPPFKDKTTVFQVAEVTDGRFELTPEEINDARELERKMALREKIRVKISDMLEVKDFAKKEEIIELNRVNGQLDKDDLADEYLHVTLVETKIMARKYEHENYRSTGTFLRKKINEYEALLLSKEPKYRTIKETVKNSFKEYCKQAREWLKQKNETLSQRSKNDDPISFIDDANKQINYLKQAWNAAQLGSSREPDIEEIEYTITDSSSLMSSIDDFRARLLEGTQKKEIKGCYLLPYQTETEGALYKWFHLLLIGRNGEFTKMHIKQHNVYNMAFSNKEGQPYEMGPGFRDKKGRTHETRPGHQDISDLMYLTIPGAKYAGFNYDYISMINPERLKKDEGLIEAIEDLEVGIEPWQDAIHVLSYHGCDPEHHKTCPLCQAPYALQRAVMCISVMLNECTSMDALKDALGDGLKYLTELLMQFIWRWKRMSCFLCRWDAVKGAEKFRIIMQKLTKVYDADEVGEIMYLILNVTSAGKESDMDDEGPSSQPSPSGGGDKKDKGKKQAGPPSPSAPGRDGASKEQPQPQPPIGSGQKLLQIFSVTLRGINLGDIRGILVHEERGTHVMYLSDDSGAEESSRRYGFQLSGPSIAISADVGCTFELVPKTGSTYGASKDTMMHLDDGFYYYDRLRYKSITYGTGQVLVSYAILTEAVEANLKINLLLPSTGLTYIVSGNLTATQQNGVNNLSIIPAEYDTVDEMRCHGSRKPYPRYAKPSRHLLMCTEPIELHLSPNVLTVKLGESIAIRRDLIIGGYSLHVNQVLEIPKQFGFIKNVRTRWLHGNAFWYSIRMTLISRNM